MGIVMIGDKYLATAYRLAGVKTIEADTEDSAVRKVNEVVSEGDYKIVIISERVSLKTKALRQSLLKAKRLYPMFVIVPDFDGVLDERTKELHQLVSQAVGVKLKL